MEFVKKKKIEMNMCFWKWLHMYMYYLCRDAKKRSKNDPEYDPKTLYVPESFLKQQTPVSAMYSVGNMLWYWWFFQSLVVCF